MSDLRVFRSYTKTLLDALLSPFPRSASFAMNIIDMAYDDVQRSAARNFDVDLSSNDGAGITLQDPCEMPTELPITMQNQPYIIDTGKQLHGPNSCS